jgi:hypothetical protein
VELWLESLTLAPKSKVHIRGTLSILWDFAMWRADVPTQRNPMELVTIKGATKRARKPRNLTVEEFQKFVQYLETTQWLCYASALVCELANVLLCVGRMLTGLTAGFEWNVASYVRKSMT